MGFLVLIVLIIGVSLVEITKNIFSQPKDESLSLIEAQLDKLMVDLECEDDPEKQKFYQEQISKLTDQMIKLSTKETV